MDQSIFPFILIFIAMIVIAFSLIFYVRRKGKNSKGVYTAKAMEFITNEIPFYQYEQYQVCRILDFWRCIG